MPRLVWDKMEEREFETGTDRGVLFVAKNDGTFEKGVVWNGLTSVNEANSGAEETALWADNIKYATLRSAEEYGLTVEAYGCPTEFYECDGTKIASDGVLIGQQGRKGFGFSYRTIIGNAVLGTDYGYKIHLVYGCTAAPSERGYQTINESPDAITLSWEFSTTPVNVTGFKPTAHIIIESTGVDAEKLAAFEDILYGSENDDSTLPSPDEVIAMFAV